MFKGSPGYNLGWSRDQIPWRRKSFQRNWSHTNPIILKWYCMPKHNTHLRPVWGLDSQPLEPTLLAVSVIALITRPYRQDTHRYHMFVKQTRVAFTALSKIHITHFGNVWYIAIVYMYWTVLLQHSWQRILKLPVQETLADIFDTNMQINFDNKMYNIIHLYNNVLKFSYLNYQVTAN